MPSTSPSHASCPARARRAIRPSSISSEIEEGLKVSLNDALPGIDPRNASVVVNAIAHAAGQPAT